MSDAPQARWEALARRYDLPSQPEWQKLLNHFDLSEGFALLVLLVPEADAAALCQRELEKQLQREGRQLTALKLLTPDDLRQLPNRLLAEHPSVDTGCLWMAAVEPDYYKTSAKWREAWQEALARLNAQRNPLRRQFNCSLVFVGAPWFQEVLREIAPDLWSVRTLVIRIEAAPQPADQRSGTEAVARPEFVEEFGGGDPQFALQESGKLRGVPGKELSLARLLHRAAAGFAGRDDWRAAEKLYTEALELKQRASAPAASLFATFHELAWTCQVLGHTHQSMTYAEQALKIALDIGDLHLKGIALGNLGLAHAALGDARKAIEFYEQHLKIAREIDDRRGEGTDLNNLGLAYATLGDARKAIEFYEQHLKISREISDRNGEGTALNNLGNAYADLGDARKAIEFHEQALVIAREIGDRRGEGSAIGNLGNAYYTLGYAHKAIECYGRQLIIVREIGDRRGEGTALGNNGSAYLALGDVRKAIEYYEKSLDIKHEIGDRNGEGIALWNSALAFEQLGNRAEAISRAEAALKIFEAIEDPNAAKVRAQLAQWRSSISSKTARAQTDAGPLP
ncbi:MAG: tetratricopeptide repeat protein [Verrucomicrobiota bacterium]